jgi:hypothetical protein
VKPGAVYFPYNVIHCFNLFPNSDTAVGNDRLSEVRQQETTGPETKNVFSHPLLGSFFQFHHTLLLSLVDSFWANSCIGHIYNLNFLLIRTLIFG